MEVWIPLIAALVGGLIATIPIIISNRFQAQERDKDREEKRREAKIQAREKSMGSDIDKVMDLLASLVKVTSEYMNFDYKMSVLKLRKSGGGISEDEYEKLLKTQIESLIEQTDRVTILTDSISGLIYSFDDEISSEFERLIKEVGNVGKLEVSINAEAEEKWNGVMKVAGNLQRLLREKKISIQNSEN